VVVAEEITDGRVSHGDERDAETTASFDDYHTFARLARARSTVSGQHSPGLP